ncbi:hypothetical protein JCM24511_01972 [Saitozyma sp. JCM 24511]|nr:hypothetical protein JCM24511_01972 [Saitozyma sp. JCM 24511]
MEETLSGKRDQGLPNGNSTDNETEKQRTIRCGTLEHLSVPWLTDNSPVDQSVVVTRELATEATLEAALHSATEAFSTYRLLSLDERIAIAQRFLDQLAQSREALSRDLSRQMGRAISHCGVEVDGTIKRGEHMIRLARECLSDISNTETDTPDHRRYIKRVPVGPVLVISPWNYPYFCQINAVLPALLAGNPVILKPSPQTPLCGEWFEQLYRRAGLPPLVLQVLHVTPTQVDRLVRDPRVQYVMFTGSVANGHAVIKSASDSFKGVGVELGGKDPAYVRADADLEVTVPGLVDGAFFNAGQSCCSVERIYVHSDIYDRFVNNYAERVRTYVLGEPSDPNTTMGPVVSKRSADSIRKQVADAIASGARALIPDELFPLATGDSNYVAPQVLVDVDHSMSIMKDETFGPVVGIMKVSSDDEAIRLMNDSPYGLTASIWTGSKVSQEVFESFVDRLEAGTVYLNNCDNLDPALAWSGWKDSGRGISLSKLGFDAFLRTKSVNMKMG